MGPVGSQEGTSGYPMVPYGSVHQSYTDTGQSSDPSGLVGSCRAISGSDGFPSELCFGTTGPVGARRVARLSLIDARLTYGPPGHATASPRALWRPVGTQRTPGGTVGPRLIGASPVWAARSSYWRQPVLLVIAIMCRSAQSITSRGSSVQSFGGTRCCLVKVKANSAWHDWDVFQRLKN